MKTQFCHLFLLVFAIGCANPKTDFWNSPDAYLGQLPPTDTPKIFAAQLLADSGIVLGRVGFSKSGKEFYYSYARHWFDPNGSGTKKIIFDSEKWNAPKILAEKLSNAALSADETKLYFGGMNSEVWQSEKTPNGWTKPVVYLNKAYGLYNFQPTNSGTFYTGSNADRGNKNDYSTYDFCTLTISGTDTIIRSLGTPLNTPAFDGDLYVAPDESYMIVSAKETKTYECELYISFRKADNSWTNPKSLGPLINDGVAHRFGQYVSPDGRYLFYTKGTGETDTHIYWVRFDRLLKQARESNFAPYLKTPVKNQTAQVGRYFSFAVPDDTFVDDDSNTTFGYAATLANNLPLPSWLIFDKNTKTFSGKPDLQGKYELVINANDGSEKATATFTLTITK